MSLKERLVYWQAKARHAKFNAAAAGVAVKKAEATHAEWKLHLQLAEGQVQRLTERLEQEGSQSPRAASTVPPSESVDS
jgi:hypothetical protein